VILLGSLLPSGGLQAMPISLVLGKNDDEE